MILRLEDWVAVWANDREILHHLGSLVEPDQEGLIVKQPAFRIALMRPKKGIGVTYEYQYFL